MPPSKNQVSLETTASPGKVETSWVLSACSPLSLWVVSFSELLCNRLKSWIPAPAWGLGPVCVFGHMREGENRVTAGARGRKRACVCMHVSKPACVCALPPGTTGLLLTAPLPRFITEPPSTGTSCRKNGARCSAALCAAAFKVGGCW